MKHIRILFSTGYTKPFSTYNGHIMDFTDTLDVLNKIVEITQLKENIGLKVFTYQLEKERIENKDDYKDYYYVYGLGIEMTKDWCNEHKNDKDYTINNPVKRYYGFTTNTYLNIYLQ